MSSSGNALSRNPNICASCSSLADGIDEAGELPLEPPEGEVGGLAGRAAPALEAKTDSRS